MLSFILPVFNGAALVRETVDSVYAQELDQPFEVVAVDDGSADATWQVLTELAEQRGPTFRLVRHEVNLGEGAARNSAVRASTGELLYVVDADNLLPPEMVQRQVDFLRHSGADAVSVSALRIFEGTPETIKEISPVAATNGVCGLTELLTTWRSPASHGNYLMRRQVFDVVGGYQEGLTMSAWTFCMQHVVRGYPVHVAPGTYYFHRVGHGGNWQRGERLGINDRLVLEALRADAELLPEDVAAKVRSLNDDDTFFTYLEEGRLLSGGQLPSRMQRARARWQRRALRRYARLRGW
jgi:glycosyltransferase involved in cell wall biosynthesis